MGGGKTWLESFIALMWAIERPGSSGFIVGPDYPMLTVQRDAFEARIEEIVRVNPGLTVEDLVKINRVEKRYDLFTGSTVWLKSATDPDKFRNFSIDWAVLGEAQKYGKRVHDLTRTRMRARMAGMGKMFISATVDGQNWIADMRDDAALRDDERSACFLWVSEDNPHVNREELEYAERNLPREVFLREYKADRHAGRSRLFENLDELTGGVVDMPAGSQGFTVGVDFGKVRDFTAIAVLDVATGTFVHLNRFQGVPYAGADGVYELVREVWKRYGRGFVVCDTGGPFGTAHGDSLQNDYGINRLVGLPTSAKRKSGPIENLIHAFAARRCRVPDEVVMRDGSMTRLDCATFAKEARELMTEQRAGYVRYTHPVGGHDDTLMACALAWHGRSSARRRRTAAPGTLGRFARKQPQLSRYGASR